jgi:hypothetical protein
MRFGDHRSGATVESMKRKPRPAVIVGVEEEGNDGEAVPRHCSEERGKVWNDGAACGMAANRGVGELGLQLGSRENDLYRRRRAQRVRPITLQGYVAPVDGSPYRRRKTIEERIVASVEIGLG